MKLNKLGENKRAEYAETALFAYTNEVGGGMDESSITDLLTDLRHLCDKQGYDFADLDKRAYIHYCGEKHER